MKLKQIEKLPVAKVRKKGKIIRLVTGMDGLLILDLYKDKVHAGRYVMELATGQYKYYTQGTWYTRRLYGILKDKTYDYWYSREPKDWKFEKQEEYDMAAGMIGSPASYSVFDRIDSKEYRHNSDAASDAYSRKIVRISNLMNSIREIPEDEFNEWWLNTCEGVKDEEYMFFDKEKQKYGCTACGREHTIKDGKHRQDRICPKTEKKATLIKRQDKITIKDYAIIIQNVDDTQVVERLCMVETTYSYRKKHIYTEDMIRVMLSRKGRKPKIYYNQDCRDFYGYYYSRRSCQWWDSNGASKKWHSGYLYPMEADVLKGTDYENLRLDCMTGIKMNYNGMLMKHQKAGCFEYLVKMGLFKLAEEESEMLSYWGDAMLIDTDGENAVEILGIDKQRIHRLKTLNGGRTMLKWLRIEEQTKRKISREALQKLLISKVDPDYYGFILDRMSPEKLINYVDKQYGKGKKFSNYDISTTWKDYLAMARRLGMNTSDPIVYAPRNLKQRHDELVLEIERMGDDMWVCEIAGKYPDVERICQNIKAKYEYENEKYKLIVPEHIRDIVDDGRQLHHCSASSERYFDRINKQECYIVFVRKNENLEKAFYTVEIQPDGTIRQKRTEFNRQDEEEEVVKFLKEWQKVIKKRLTAEDVALGQQSSIQREIEQMELLQKGDEKSLRVWQELEDDYLENEETEDDMEAELAAV